MRDARSIHLKRRLALFCMALCLTLCAQVTMAMQDRLKHALLVEHAPSAIAGIFDHGHDDHHAHESPARHDHDDGLPAGENPDEFSVDEFPGDSKSLAHHHHGGGAFAPWLVSAPIFIPAHDAAAVIVSPRLTAHSDAATWRRERPPKFRLETLA